MLRAAAVCPRTSIVGSAEISIDGTPTNSSDGFSVLRIRCLVSVPIFRAFAASDCVIMWVACDETSNERRLMSSRPVLVVSMVISLPFTSPILRADACDVAVRICVAWCVRSTV